mmetsp:Transcript_37462/g.60383  ORF Transcript_37462/g.60383 Transcript_37462/m.60383 type:complete len:133 (-) Transcript_37462:14-412(-)
MQHTRVNAVSTHVSAVSTHVSARDVTVSTSAAWQPVLKYHSEDILHTAIRRNQQWSFEMGGGERMRDSRASGKRATHGVSGTVHWRRGRERERGERGARGESVCVGEKEREKREKRKKELRWKNDATHCNTL